MKNKLPSKCVIDTNVAVVANKNLHPDGISPHCILNCIEAIEHITQKRGILVLDNQGEITTEYRQNLSSKGQPGVGDQFMKWVHDNQWNRHKVNRVDIHQEEDSYREFPVHPGLMTFDLSDRKFVATANAHPEKPPILEATDSKWWGWKDALEEIGLQVHFLCPKYIKDTYNKKISDCCG